MLAFRLLLSHRSKRSCQYINLLAASWAFKLLRKRTNQSLADSERIKEKTISRMRLIISKLFEICARLVFEKSDTLQLVLKSFLVLRHSRGTNKRRHHLFTTPIVHEKGTDLAWDKKAYLESNFLKQ